ncbi:ATP-binding cassette domain-containing protein [Paenibacillus sp. YYML68]|uniref:ATP-binding cassette domain-containing protein n=1 Tax=Paenibacillus sp. YYML68 TaxID=2909250 RepID=UPI00248FC2A5|nr:ATP-binding cassette domain-containing protein [Paenibacillus sp. YYML68]
MIQFDNVTYSYIPHAQPVLQAVSFTIPRGQLTAIIGANGSGKSTAAQLIAGLLQPDEGSVRLLGKADDRTRGTLLGQAEAPMHSLDQEKNHLHAHSQVRLQGAEPSNVRRPRVGIVFQNPDDQIVAPTVAEDVAFGLENLAYPSALMMDRVLEALEQVGMASHAEAEIERLSGGQKQRVAIAGVLALQPDVIVFDEASSMLDPVGREQLLRIQKQLRDQGLTIVTITHHMDEAILADHVIVLHEGKLIRCGSPRQLFCTDAAADANANAVAAVDVAAELDLPLPFAVEAREELIRRGVPIPRTILTEGELVEYLCTFDWSK